MNYHDISLKFEAWLRYYGPRAIGALILLIVGLWVIRIIARAINRLMIVREVEPTVRSFLRSFSTIVLKVVLFLMVASTLGIATTSLLTAVWAAGLAIGLALQGSLSNFAGGVLILVFKPFKVGDLIQAHGHNGTVKDIQILYTILLTADNKRIVLPNGALANEDVINFSAETTRRIDLELVLTYSANTLKVKQILDKISQSSKYILRDPAPITGVSRLEELTIRYSYYYWVNLEHVADANFEVNNLIRDAFLEEGLDFGPVSKEIYYMKST